MTTESTVTSSGPAAACCGGAAAGRGGGKLSALPYTAFLLLAVGLLVLGYASTAWREFSGQVAINFVSIMVEALPFVLIGALISGLIEVFIPREWLGKWLGQGRFYPVFMAAALGLLFPICECAVVPVVRRLLRKGMPLAAAIAYLLAGPIFNPIVAASTAVAYKFDWIYVILRMGLGYSIAVSVGLIMGAIFRHRPAVQEPGDNRDAATDGDRCCGDGEGSERLSRKLLNALSDARDDFFEVAKFLVIGAFLAGLVRSTVSVETFQGLASTPWLAILLMMVLAIALNLCSEADAFIAASFRGVLPGSAQLAFIVLGPMLDVKLMLMYLSVFRKRVVILLPLVIFGLVLAAMLGVELLMGGMLDARP